MHFDVIKTWHFLFHYTEQKEDIWFFQCKIKFYFTEWTPKAVFSRVTVAKSENTSFGVHEWNKIRSYTEKNHIFCFFYAFIHNN